MSTSTLASVTASGSVESGDTGSVACPGVLDLNAGTNTSGSAPVLTPTFSSGVAAQLTDLTRDYMVYLEIGTAGTANVLTIGPTSTPANTVIASGTATAGEIMTVRLPAGWYLEWSAT